MSKSIVFNPRNCDDGIEFETCVMDFLNNWDKLSNYSNLWIYTKF